MQSHDQPEANLLVPPDGWDSACQRSGRRCRHEAGETTPDSRQRHQRRARSGFSRREKTKHAATGTDETAGSNVDVDVDINVAEGDGCGGDLPQLHVRLADGSTAVCIGLDATNSYALFQPLQPVATTTSSASLSPTSLAGRPDEETSEAALAADRIVPFAWLSSGATFFLSSPNLLIPSPSLLDSDANTSENPAPSEASASLEITTCGQRQAASDSEAIRRPGDPNSPPLQGIPSDGNTDKPKVMPTFAYSQLPHRNRDSNSLFSDPVDLDAKWD
ncbi:unnamed protein product [Protopolystoma xenopodis]|uniref:Uncharacterized protein n=1 Tax=Protopolystoma xenopodis TaxID=117903 RepID=A0A3S5AUA7_9PLAT|nr:unnamed protein product [Protopolystoma xenopodis]